MSEIFEFAARLCQAQVYTGVLNIDIKVKGIKGFVLAPEGGRTWPNYYAASENELSHTWSLQSDILVAESSEKALAAITWYFERFGWLSPSQEIIRSEQNKFLKVRN